MIALRCALTSIGTSLNAKIENVETELKTIENKSEVDLWEEDIQIIEDGLKKVTGSGIKDKVKFQIKKKKH